MMFVFWFVIADEHLLNNYISYGRMGVEYCNICSIVCLIYLIKCLFQLVFQCNIFFQNELFQYFAHHLFHYKCHKSILESCKAGTYLGPYNTCSNCPKGTYQPKKWQTSCIDCPDGQKTLNERSTNIVDCYCECF